METGFGTFGVDPLGDAAPQTPRGILTTKKIGSKLLAFGLVLTGTGVSASSQCSLACKPMLDCTQITVSWDEARTDEIEVDGKTISATRIASATIMDTMRVGTKEVEIRAQRPLILLRGDRQTGSIALAEDGNVVLTLIQVPKRYVEYENAMRTRRVASGPCEGLF